MEGDSTSLVDRIERSLQAHGEYLESTALPRLAELTSLHRTCFESVYNILLRKALVREDPYKHDERVADVEVPDAGAFHESEREEQLSLRLSAYLSQIEFLCSVGPPSLEFLTPARLRRLTDLFCYIRWDRLTATGGSPATAALAELVDLVRGGADRMSAQIVGDAIGRLAANVQEVLQVLDAAGLHRREAYKLRLRRILPQLTGPPTDEAAQIRAACAREGIEPFRPDLAAQVLAENRGEGAEEVLKQLAVRTEKASAPKKADHKDLLLKAVRTLAAAGRELQDCAVKIAGNHEQFGERRPRFGHGLARFIRRIAGGKPPSAVYKIEVADGRSSTPRPEALILDPFLEELRKRGRLLSALALSQSSASVRLHQASEDQVLQFLGKQITALQTLHRRLHGLNEHFRARVSERKDRPRGLRVELTAIRNAILKGNQERHEYVALREEEEQLRKLGVGDGG